VPGQVIQQRSLAYPRLAPYDQHPAFAGANRSDEPFKYRALAAPTS
jgi:hypothetical protein